MTNPRRELIEQEVLAVDFPYRDTTKSICFDRHDYHAAWLFVLALADYNLVSKVEVKWVLLSEHDKDSSFKARQQVLQSLSVNKIDKDNRHARLLEVANNLGWCYPELCILLQDINYLSFGLEGYAISYDDYIYGGTRDGEYDRYHVVKYGGRLQLVGWNWEEENGVVFVPYLEPDRATPEEILETAEAEGLIIQDFD